MAGPPIRAVATPRPFVRPARPRRAHRDRAVRDLPRADRGFPCAWAELRQPCADEGNPRDLELPDGRRLRPADGDPAGWPRPERRLDDDARRRARLQVDRRLGFRGRVGRTRDSRDYRGAWRLQRHWREPREDPALHHDARDGRDPLWRDTRLHPGHAHRPAVRAALRIVREHVRLAHRSCT